MNNNNRNNRRRGRGNRTQNGNGSQLNRIDSRARGNAPQMLDKYKKLAQDAHHNGDRVQMEYYLQFADHYFRVIADNKARVDEARGGRRGDERDQAEENSDDDFDFGRRNEPSSRSRYEQQDNDARGDTRGDTRNDSGANADEGEPGHEGEPFLIDENGEDTEQYQQRPQAPRAQQPQRRQPRKPREDTRPERAERPEAPRSEKRAEKRAPRPRKPRKPLDSDNGVIDSSILPPSIRGEDSRDTSGDSDGTLEAVG